MLSMFGIGPEFLSSGAPIPKAINFIWVGDNALPERYQLNILLCLLQNRANYAINLWVNPDYFTDRDNPKYTAFRFLESHGVKLRNYGSLAPTDAAAKDVLAKVHEVHRVKPVVAADLLRLVILQEEGGYYMDTDTHILEAMPTWQVRFLNGKQFMFEVATHGFMNTSVSTNNSFIAAAAKSPELKACLEVAQETLRDKTPGEIAGWGKHSVIEWTGPGLLERGIEKASRTEKASRAEVTFDSDRAGLLLPYGVSKYSSLSGVGHHTFDTTWLDPGSERAEKFAAEDRRAAHVLALWRENPRTELASAYTLDLEPFYKSRSTASAPARGADALRAVTPWAVVAGVGAGGSSESAAAAGGAGASSEPAAAAGAGGYSGPASATAR